MDFAESTQYLFSLGNEVSAMKLGLENIRKLLSALGNPQDNYLKVQVAGTNGKGSVCAFLDSICNTAGIKTGTFTSPHLISITERIRINGINIGEEDFAIHATHVRKTLESLVTKGALDYLPTFFEQVTAIALIAFADAKVELAILETGLGGRLDATTAAKAAIAAITRIDFDHQEYLGDTIEEIGAEKAAIIHSGSRVVIGEQNREAANVLTSFSTNLGVTPRSVEKEVRTTHGDKWLMFETEQASYHILSLGLKGRHQIENAKVAIILAETLQDDFQITVDDIVNGLQSARNPGRLEYMGKYLFDGAHNIGGAKALAEYICEFERRPITVVFGAMRGKNVAEILSVIAPLADRIIFTEPANTRSLSYDGLLESLPKDMLKVRVFVTDNVISAIDIANNVTTDEYLTLVTGSLYLVGEAKKMLNN